MNLRPLLIIPPLAVAIGVFVLMNRPGPETTEDATEQALAVRVQSVKPQEVVGVATGYGRAEAIRTWSAIAEIQARIVGMADGVAVGNVVDQGTVLVELDTTDYELARKKALANIASVEAQLAELEQQEENSKAMLAVEERILAVAEAEFDRIESLVDRGASTQAALDTVQKTLLGQTVSVANLRDAISLYPAKRQSLEATMSLRQSEVAEAERSIEKATITAPFRGRISTSNIEVGQYARVGDVMLDLDDVAAVEITAEMQPSEFGPIVALAFRNRLGADDTIDTTKAVDLLNAAGITAEVSLAQSGLNARWPAELVRMRGTLDATTGALGLVVRVDDPLVSVRPVNRPPLNTGTFTEVSFNTGPVPDVIAIPRTAVRFDDQGAPFVYLVDEASRLASTPIRTGPTLGANVVVREGLTGGETLVLSAPRPPVPGMLLETVAVDGATE